VANTFELAEAVVKLTGNPAGWNATLNQMEQDVVAHEAKVTSIAYRSAQTRAEGIRKINERAQQKVLLMQETFKYGAGIAKFRANERWVKEGKDLDREQNAAKFGRGVANFIESRREQKEERRTQRLIDAYRFGKVGGAVVGGMRTFKDSMEGTRPAALTGMAMGAGAIGMAGAASPFAMNTFTESLTLAAARIGKDFTPALIELSFTVQRASAWWETLDKGIKKNVVELTKFVAVSGAMLLALGGLARVGAIIAGLATMNPLLLGAGLVAGAGVLASMRSGPTAKDELQANEAQIKALEDRKKALDPNRKELQFGDMLGAGRANQLGEVDAKLKGLRDAQVGIKKRADAENSGLFGSMGPSSFSSLQDFYKKVLLDTTGGSEINAKILEIQAQQLVELVEIRKQGNKPGVVK
jgi:hypothetical protein